MLFIYNIKIFIFKLLFNEFLFAQQSLYLYITEFLHSLVCKIDIRIDIMKILSCVFSKLLSIFSKIFTNMVNIFGYMN